MVYIVDTDFIIKVKRPGGLEPGGTYTFVANNVMAHSYSSVPVEDEGDTYFMVLTVPGVFARSLASGEYVYTVQADNFGVIATGLARKKETGFPADSVYVGTVDERTRYNVSIFSSQGGYLMVNGQRYQNYVQSVPEGQILAVQAVSEAGYLFTAWSDGNTDNPRTITVTEDITLFAAYEAAEYTVSISAGSNGSVSVNGTPVVGTYTDTVNYGATLTLAATADNGYQFSQWTDGNTDNPRTVTVTGPVALAAAFQEAVQYFNVSISAGANGSVSVNGVTGDYQAVLPLNTQLTLEATPSTGYNFTQWSDGNTDNPRTITVTGPVALAAAFQEAVQYFNVSIAAGSNGSVSVNNVPGDFQAVLPLNTQLTLEATPSTGYNFTQWTDGNNDNPRTITVTGDITLSASFQIQEFTVTLTAGANGLISVDGGAATSSYSGTAIYGSTVAVEAVPNTGFYFSQWTDGDTSNPRTITVTENVYLASAYSTQLFTVTVTPDPNCPVYVNGHEYTTTYTRSDVRYGENYVIEARPATGYSWSSWNDGSTTNPRILQITSNVSLTPSVTVSEYWVWVTPGANGTTEVNGTALSGTYHQKHTYGSTITLGATPDADYQFVSWGDGNTDNPRTITVTGAVNVTSTFEEAVQPSALNTIGYTTTDSQVNSAWLTAYDSDNNALTPTETSTYGRIVFGEPVYKIVVNTDNASNIESITTSYKTEVVAYSGTSSLSNCTSLTLKSPHMVSADFTPFTALQSLESWHANDDVQYTGVSNLPASGTCVTRTDNNLWEHSDLSGWTFQALGTVITYEAEEQMDLEYHHVHNRVSYDIQPASHTFSDGVGTITYDETVGELSDSWEGCDKLYLPDTVGYFNMCEYLPQAMEVGEYFGVVGGSMDAGEDWNYTQLFNNGIQPDCAVTVCQDNPILTIGTDGCLYNKENWMGLNVVNQTVTDSTVALLDMDDRCVDASTCMFNGIGGGCPFTITRLVLGDSCESLRLYPLNGWDSGCLSINEIVLNDTLQMFNPGGERISHASGGSNNPYLNVINNGYAIESEDGTTIYWCGSNQVDLSGYTHFAEGCCAYLSFSSMPDISSATQVDRDAFHNISGVGTWVWPDNNIVFNGRHIIRNESGMTRIEFGSHSVTFNNDEVEGLFECWNFNTIVFNSQLIPTQLDQNNWVFQELPSVGTVYIPLGSDYSTFLNYPGNAGNIGLWNLKYLMDNTQLAIKHTPGVTITAPTLTGLAMVASADSNGWLKVTYSGNITTYDSTDLQNNTDVLEVVLPDSCLSVGNGAFLGCSNLAKVAVSDSCTSIGNSAFYGTAITEFSAKGVTSFGTGAFGNCTSLVSVEFGENLATLGEDLFDNCSSLEYVGFEGATGPTITNNDLGSGIHATGTIYIPRYANDASYADFIAAMPSGWTVIRRKQNQILYQTTDGQQINVPSEINGSPLIKHIYFNGWGVIEYAGTRLYQIPEYRFSDNSNLSALYIPSIAANIGSSAFENCDNLTTVEIQDCTDIDWNVFNASPIVNGPDTGKLTLPPSVGYIWGGAFASLESSEIEFGPALHSIDADTFNLQNATTIYVYTDRQMEDQGDPFLNTPGSGTLHMVTGADAAYWTQYLPGWTVTYDLHVINYTSSDNKPVTPNRLDAFGSNFRYTWCHPDEGNGVMCFDGPVTDILTDAFMGCTNLDTITIPSGVTEIHSNAFKGCTSLRYVQIPSTVTTLDDYVFSLCTSLVGINVTYPAGNLALPESVTTIGGHTFDGCTAAPMATVPSGVTALPTYMFRNCSRLSHIRFRSTTTAPSVGTGAFDGLPNLGEVLGKSGVNYSAIMAALPSGWVLNYE